MMVYQRLFVQTFKAVEGTQHVGYDARYVDNAKDSTRSTGRKLNAHKTEKTFRRRPGRLLNVLCMFHLCRVSTGEWKRESVIWTGPDL